MKDQKTILVTGGAGYLGSVLVPKLLQEGHRVKVLDCLFFSAEPLKAVINHPRLEMIKNDMLNHENHADLFHDVDSVVHLAGISNDPSSDLDPNLAVRVNFFATLSLARRAKLSGVKRFIFMSSCAVYGGEPEKLLDETSEPSPLSLYALTKLECERSLLALHSPDFSITILRLSTLFGLSPRMRFDLAINVMVKRAIQGHDLLVYGAGRQYRPFLHVADAAETIISVVERPDRAAAGEVFNVGRDDMNFRITELAHLLHGIFPKVSIKNAPESPDQRSYNVSFAKIRQELGIVPKRDVNFGAAELAAAFQSGRFPDPENQIFYNLAVLKNMGKDTPTFYSPASTPVWIEAIPAKPAASNVVPIRKQKVVAIILAYNTGSMLKTAFDRIPKHLVDDIVVMDDCSRDDTSAVAKSLGLKVYRHEKNLGYGGNLKAGLKRALDLGADYIVEVHGDGAQFNPASIEFAAPHMQAEAGLILGSRFQNKWLALANGMSLIRFCANIFLSFFDRMILRLPLTEFHTGFRIYSKSLLSRVPYEANANNYLFSFQIIAQAAYYDEKVAEVPVEADYHAAHTSHSLRGASVYAINTFIQLGHFLLAKAGVRFNSVFRDRDKMPLSIASAGPGAVKPAERRDEKLVERPDERLGA